jgi:hypothetical protein
MRQPPPSDYAHPLVRIPILKDSMIDVRVSRIELDEVIELLQNGGGPELAAIVKEALMILDEAKAADE